MKLKRMTACILAGAMAMSVALTGCGSSINADAVGATLNEKEISLGFMNFMARYQQANTDQMYLSYFGSTSLDMWKYAASEEEGTMEDSTKESVAESIELMYLLEEHMADYGVEITEEELTAMDEAAKQFMSDNSKKAIKQLGATEEYVKEMLRLYTIQHKMQTAIYDDTEVTITDEEAAQRTFSYIRTSITTGKDADGNSITYTDEQKKALEEEMQQVAKDAKEDFDAAGTAAKEKGYTSSTYSYGSDETYATIPEAVIKAADAMKEGDISELITTDDDYFVIRLDSEFDEEKTEAKKTSLTNQKKSEAYTAICDGYKEEASFELNEDEWAKVKFNRLFGLPASENKK